MALGMHWDVLGWHWDALRQMGIQQDGTGLCWNALAWYWEALGCNRKAV